MMHDDENENSKDGECTRNPGSVSECSSMKEETQFVIPQVVIDSENSDNLNDAGTSIVANSNGEHNSSPQQTPDISESTSALCKNNTNTSTKHYDNSTLSRPRSTKEKIAENNLSASDSRLVRSTSLKSIDTPHCTSTQKKIVRFADALGLDLEDVRHFCKGRTPTVPHSAFSNLHMSPSGHSMMPLFDFDPDLAKSNYVFVPEFPQPGTDPHFLAKIREQKVCLDAVVVNGLRVTGVVRTLNIGFEKFVQVRYTVDEWFSHRDTTAQYLPQSSDGFSDKFTFNITLPNAQPNEKLIFVIKYVVNNKEYWDNNSGQNYTLTTKTKDS